MVARATFVLYLALLVWIVLFKLSLDPAWMFEYPSRSVELMPFRDTSPVALRGAELNLAVFVPFGLFISLVARPSRSVWWRQLPIAACSVAFESIQYLFGIGATDATDVVSNSAGGLVGILTYELARRWLKVPRLHAVLTCSMALALAAVIATLVVHRLPDQLPSRDCFLVPNPHVTLTHEAQPLRCGYARDSP